MAIIEWGLILGISTAMIPGPLMAMVVTQTLLKGWRAGVAVACAPLVTDAPIIVLSVLVLRSIPSSKVLIAGIGICGAAYLLYLAVQFWKTPSEKCASRSVPDLDRAILSNFLNPGPYIFWGTVGGTILREQVASSWSRGLLFPVAYYTALVGAKMLMALTLGKSESLFSSRAIYYLNRAASLAFVAFAAKLVSAAFPNL